MILTPMLLWLALVGAPPMDPLEAALESFATVHDYRVTLRSGLGDAKETIRYFYKKPGFIRMEFIRPHNGALLVYDPTTKTVRLRPFGFATAFVLTLSPDNRLVQSAQGHRVDESDIGSLLRRVKQLRGHGTTTIRGEARVNGNDTVMVSVEGEKGVALEGVHRYLLWLDRKTLLPLKTAAYDVSGKQIEEVSMDDLELNRDLDESLFRL